jgi:hypothetical protein
MTLVTLSNTLPFAQTCVDPRPSTWWKGTRSKVWEWGYDTVFKLPGKPHTLDSNLNEAQGISHTKPSALVHMIHATEPK